MANFKIYKVNSLPANPVASAMYLVYIPGTFSVACYVTDNSGQVYNVCSDLNSVLSIGNGSSLGITVGNILTTSITLPAIINAPHLGTDANGHLIATTSSRKNVKTIPADDYTVQANDEVLILPHITESKTITLPSAESGRELCFIHKGSSSSSTYVFSDNIIISDPVGTTVRSNIWGGNSITIISDGTSWFQKQFTD